MAVTVYVEELLQNKLSNAELTNLSENFKLYKENKAGALLGVQLGSENFGKDESLTQPPEIRGVLNKVHIKPNNPREQIRLWMSRINQGLVPISDHVLIYCSGKTDLDAYLLIDIFRPNGHLKMKDFKHLKDLKTYFADPFQEEF